MVTVTVRSILLIALMFIPVLLLALFATAADALMGEP